MKFDLSYPTISEADCRNTFELSPASLSKLLSQTRKITNRTTDGDSFDVRDFADDFKVHRLASCQASFADKQREGIVIK